MNKFFRSYLIPIYALSFSTILQSGPLPLDEYLKQVSVGNQSLSASKMTSEASLEKSSDSEMVYAPTVFATIQSAVDKKEQVPEAMRGNQTDNISTQVGVSQMTRWGTAGKVYLSTSQTNIHGTSPQFMPEPSWKELAPTVEVSHPLWKNSLGKDLAKSIELEKSKATLTQFSETMKRKVTLAEAEGIYWRLVLARENIRITKENLTRAEKIVSWNQRRVQNELADRADLIQAESLGEIRQMELQAAVDEERAAAHAFNTSRGENSPEVKEELLKITPELIGSLSIPQKKGDREDVRAMIEAEKLSDLGADLSSNKYDPSLDIFALGTLNGRDLASYSKAAQDSFKAKHATYAVGLKFSAPLGGESLSHLRSGYAKDREAAKLNTARRRYENEREWNDLTRKFDEIKSRLTLMQKIESTQERKLVAERDRQAKGRSTMFQVMQCESDLASAQFNVIRGKAEILGLMARMKTFGGEL